MGALAPRPAPFLVAAAGLAVAIAVAAAVLGTYLFDADVDLVPTIITSLVVGTFVALWILARQDHEGFDVESAREVRAETEGFDTEEVQHEAIGRPRRSDDEAERDEADDAADQKPKRRGAPTRRIS